MAVSMIHETAVNSRDMKTTPVDPQYTYVSGKKCRP